MVNVDRAMIPADQNAQVQIYENHQSIMSMSFMNNSPNSRLRAGAIFQFEGRQCEVMGHAENSSNDTTVLTVRILPDAHHIGTTHIPETPEQRRERLTNDPVAFAHEVMGGGTPENPYRHEHFQLPAEEKIGKSVKELLQKKNMIPKDPLEPSIENFEKAMINMRTNRSNVVEWIIEELDGKVRINAKVFARINTLLNQESDEGAFFEAPTVEGIVEIVLSEQNEGKFKSKPKTKRVIAL